MYQRSRLLAQLSNFLNSENILYMIRKLFGYFIQSRYRGLKSRTTSYYHWNSNITIIDYTIYVQLYYFELALLFLLSFDTIRQMENNLTPGTRQVPKNSLVCWARHSIAILCYRLKTI